MEVSLEKATLADAEVLWEMQKRSFAALLARYQDYETSPATETLARIEERLRRPERHYYFILCEGEKAGAICVVDPYRAPGAKRISPLFILPEYQNRGIAQAAIREVECLHGAHNWSLDTILQEPGNCHLYEKMGYRRVGEPRPVNERLTLIDYEKP